MIFEAKLSKNSLRAPKTLKMLRDLPPTSVLRKSTHLSPLRFRLTLENIRETPKNREENDGLGCGRGG